MKWRHSTNRGAPSGPRTQVRLTLTSRARTVCLHFKRALEECCFLNTAEVTRSGVLLWHQCYLAPVVRPEGHLTTVLSHTFLTWMIYNGFPRAVLLNWCSLGTHSYSTALHFIPQEPTFCLSDQEMIELNSVSFKKTYNTIPPSLFFKKTAHGAVSQSKPCDPPVENRRPNTNALCPFGNRTVGASNWMLRPLVMLSLLQWKSECSTAPYCLFSAQRNAQVKSRGSSFSLLFFSFTLFVCGVCVCVCVWVVGI